MANKHTIKESSQDEARLTETSRTAALSDGVFAITITLLVLEIHRPEGYEPGGLLHALLENWPSYLAYAVSFLYIGVLWLNHHSLFSKLRRVNLGFRWINLGILFTTAVLPFPTAVLASALAPGTSPYDQRVAVTVSTRSPPRRCLPPGCPSSPICVTTRSCCSRPPLRSTSALSACAR